MKNNLLRTSMCLALPLLLGLLLASCTNTPEAKKSGYALNLAQSSSLCQSNWFPHSQTPAPAEGIGSPFDTSSTTNSIFHQWSWQKFLWLTKPLPSGHPLFADSLTLVTSQLLPVQPMMGVSLVLTDSAQAGPQGVLMSNPTFNGQTRTVYYGIFANDILLHFAQAMKAAILKDPGKVSNDTTFPIGSLELKTSWVQASTIPASQLSSYYTTKAYISAIKDTATVALLGMHVVGVVINHPEFIWATFEHHNMAGYYDWAATTNQDVAVTSSDNLLFFTKGYSATVADINYTPPPVPKNVFTLFQYGIPRTAQNAIMPNLSQDSSSNLSNYNNIINLNQCVAASLTDVWKNYFYNGSIWLNTDGLTLTQQVDSMLAAGNAVGSAKTGSSARGALAAFNITMETFVQSYGQAPIHSMNAAQLTNCMSCHTGIANIKLGSTPYPNSASPLYFSHIFRSYLSVSSGVPITAVQRLRLEEFLSMKARALKE